MKKIHNFSISSIVLALLIIILDLVIKYLITKNFMIGEMRSIIDGMVSIGRVENFRMALGLIGYFIKIIVLSIQLACVILFFIIQKREINILYKYSITLIVFGWIGNYLDGIFFSNGDSGYVCLDYLYFNGIDFLINVSSVMNLIGWLLLIFAIISKFKEFKNLFKKG